MAVYALSLYARELLTRGRGRLNELSMCRLRHRYATSTRRTGTTFLRGVRPRDLTAESSDTQLK